MKRTLKVIAIVLCLLVLVVCGLGFLATKSTWAQKKIGQFLTERLSTDIGAEVSFEAIELNLFTDFILEGIYIEDLSGDTLLYAKKVQGDISLFESGEKKLHFSKLIFDQPFFNFKRLEGDSTDNFQFIIDKYFLEDRDKNPDQWEVATEAIEIINGRFNRNDLNRPLQSTFDISHLELSEVNAVIDEIDIAEGSIAGNINQLSFQERCGLTIDELTCGLLLTPIDLQYSNLTVKTPKSNLFIDGQMQYEKGAYFNNFMEDVVIVPP